MQRGNACDTEGRWWTYIMSFCWRKKLLTIWFFTPCDNKTINSSPRCLFIPSISFSAVCFLSALCVVCLVSCSDASGEQKRVLQVGVISLLAAAVKGNNRNIPVFTLHTLTVTARITLPGTHVSKTTHNRTFVPAMGYLLIPQYDIVLLYLNLLQLQEMSSYEAT